MKTLVVVLAGGVAPLLIAQQPTPQAHAEDAESSVASNPANAIADVRWPAPVLTDRNLDEWLRFIRPTADELKWRNVRWHTSLAPAIEEAKRLQRPILLWTMNGNPCGET